MMVVNTLEKMWSEKKIGFRWCVNVVRIVMPSVLDFDDGSHHARKKNVVKIAMLNVLGFNDANHHC